MKRRRLANSIRRGRLRKKEMAEVRNGQGRAADTFLAEPMQYLRRYRELPTSQQPAALFPHLHCVHQQDSLLHLDLIL
ncbi:unnamed protein product [Cuscuta campestris]|uniref:Uncharacterized protein n=1 Tax=Cuscuta campestris TaxID=132261 RepID=A0A484LSP6_9ASTE|nr:unnamed protein product [Cuscuta campestris]